MTTQRQVWITRMTGRAAHPENSSQHYLRAGEPHSGFVPVTRITLSPPSQSQPAHLCRPQIQAGRSHWGHVFRRNLNALRRKRGQGLFKVSFNLQNRNSLKHRRYGEGLLHDHFTTHRRLAEMALCRFPRHLFVLLFLFF